MQDYWVAHALERYVCCLQEILSAGLHPTGLFVVLGFRYRLEMLHLLSGKDARHPSHCMCSHLSVDTVMCVGAPACACVLLRLYMCLSPCAWVCQGALRSWCLTVRAVTPLTGSHGASVGMGTHTVPTRYMCSIGPAQDIKGPATCTPAPHTLHPIPCRLNIPQAHTPRFILYSLHPMPDSRTIHATCHGFSMAQRLRFRWRGAAGVVGFSTGVGQ